MKSFKLALSVAGILMLAACANTAKGIEADVNTTQGPDGSPSVVQKIYNSIPTGYYGQTGQRNTGYYAREGGPVLEAMDQPDARPDLSVAPPSLPKGVEYNESVTVYPLEDEENAKAVSVTAGDDGELLQEIFFAHGSAKIGTADRAGLRDLGQSLVTSGKDYSLSVVGHASRRVNGVSDPEQKRLINFKMAQKRANAVSDELRKSGVKPGWVMVTSRGDEEPNPEPGDKSQEDADRRVEVYMGK